MPKAKARRQLRPHRNPGGKRRCALMASEWFIYREKERRGPYSSAEIRSLARSGELLPGDCLWKEGMRKKRRAGNSSALFPRGQRRSKPAEAEESKAWETWLDDVPLSQPIVLGGGFAVLAALFAWLALAGLRTSAIVDRPPSATRPLVGAMGDEASPGNASLPEHAGQPAGKEDAGGGQRESDDGGESPDAPSHPDAATSSAPQDEPASSVPDDF
jgi:hypothetical protein